MCEYTTQKAAAIQRRQKNPLGFSKKLMVFASVMYAATWIVSVISIFYLQEYPIELKNMATWLYGANMAVYNAKAALENKTRIENSTVEVV